MNPVGVIHMPYWKKAFANQQVAIIIISIIIGFACNRSILFWAAFSWESNGGASNGNHGPMILHAIVKMLHPLRCLHVP